MIKCRVTQNFTLGEFDKLTNIQRYCGGKDGELRVNDTFECDEKMVKYLTGDNKEKVCVVEVIEVIPEETKKKKNGKK